MMSKQIKKLRSNAEKHRIVIGLVVVVLAVFAASFSQLQTGFIASESGFTVPFPDGEARIGENSTIDLVWSVNETLESLGFEYYEILVQVNGQGFECNYSAAVSGNSVTYTVDGADYGQKVTLIIRLMLFSPTGEVGGDSETIYDVTWDDVTVLILDDPAIYNPTTTTTTALPQPLPTTIGVQDIFVYILFGVGGLMVMMVIGTIFVRKRRKVGGRVK